MANKTIHTWVVPNFSKLMKEANNKDHTFKFELMNDSNAKFQVWLWPNGINSKQYVRIKMGIENADNKKYQSRIAVISTNGEEWMETDGIINSIDIDGNQAYINTPEIVIHHTLIIALKDQILPDDKLTIRCEVSEYNEHDLQSVQADFSSLLSHPTLSDVVCEAGNKKFQLHKVILAARSPVFKAMFTNNMLEARSNRVNVPDITAQAFEQVLQFIYSGKVPDMNRFALELFTFADKYQIESLKTICMRSMMRDMKLVTVVDVLLLAELHNAEQLKTKCVDFIKSNFADVQQQLNWGKLNNKPNLLLELYNEIDLNVESVIDVLILADAHNNRNLKQKCIDFIKVNKDQVKQQPNFRTLQGNREKRELLLELLVEFM